MKRQDIEAIVRSVATQYGVVAKLTGIERLERDWSVELCGEAGTRVRIVVPGGSPHLTRRSVMNALRIDG